MMELKIPLRTPWKEVKIPKAELKNLYLEKGLSSRKIAKIYNCAYSTIDRMIRKFEFPIKTLSASHITTHRSNFSQDPLEKAYLIGFAMGDLRVRKMYKNSETILVDCASTKKEQIKLITKLLVQYGRIWTSKPHESGKVHIECSLNDTFSFLLKKRCKFPKWTTTKKELFLSILAGFIDAEGSFFLLAEGKSAAFSLGNYNKTVLKQIQKVLLEKFDIASKLSMAVKKGYCGKNGYAHNGDYWILSITKKSDLYRFSNIIRTYIRHEKRIVDVEKVMDNIRYRNKVYGYIGMQKEGNLI